LHDGTDERAETRVVARLRGSGRAVCTGGVADEAALKKNAAHAPCVHTVDD
jgi:hypothetical protein